MVFKSIWAMFSGFYIPVSYVAWIPYFGALIIGCAPDAGTFFEGFWELLERGGMDP